jgi:transposase
MSTLLSTKLGAEGAYYFSNSGPNRDVLGYRHRMLLHKSDADELLNRHRYGKQIKMYHPEYVHGDPEEARYHPKLGVLFDFSKEHLGNGGNSVPWSRLEELIRELRETLTNLVSWSGLTTKPDPTTYVPDDAFELQEAEEPVQLVKDPLPQVEADQEALLMKTLGDLTPSDERLLQVVADGGEVSVHEAAEETDRSLSTIYRALDRLGDLLRNDSGTLSFVSEKLQQELSGVLSETESALESGVRRLCELLDLDPRQLEQKGSAWQKWLARWGAEAVEHGDQSDRMLIKISTMMDRLRATDRPLVDEIVAEAYEAWCNSGGPRGDWWDAQVRWTNGADQTHTVSVSALLEPDGSPVRSAPG